jgi:hypothetical protein
MGENTHETDRLEIIISDNFKIVLDEFSYVVEVTRKNDGLNKFGKQYKQPTSKTRHYFPTLLTACQYVIDEYPRETLAVTTTNLIVSAIKQASAELVLNYVCDYRKIE